VAQQRDLTLNENNDEKVNFTLTTNDPADETPLDLTGMSLTFVLKPSKSTDDGAAGAWTGTDTAGDITVTDPAGGLCYVKIPRAHVTLTQGWYRLDVTEIASDLLKTSVYGAVTVTDL
jgi:hypothetical protein